MHDVHFGPRECGSIMRAESQLAGDYDSIWSLFPVSIDVVQSLLGRLVVGAEV